MPEGTRSMGVGTGSVGVGMVCQEVLLSLDHLLYPSVILYPWKVVLHP